MAASGSGAAPRYVAPPESGLHGWRDFLAARCERDVGPTRMHEVANAALKLARSEAGVAWSDDKCECGAAVMGDDGRTPAQRVADLQHGWATEWQTHMREGSPEDVADRRRDVAAFRSSIAVVLRRSDAAHFATWIKALEAKAVPEMVADVAFRMVGADRTAAVNALHTAMYNDALRPDSQIRDLVMRTAAGILWPLQAIDLVACTQCTWRAQEAWFHRGIVARGATRADAQLLMAAFCTGRPLNIPSAWVDLAHEEMRVRNAETDRRWAAQKSHGVIALGLSPGLAPSLMSPCASPPHLDLTGTRDWDSSASYGLGPCRRNSESADWYDLA